MDNRSVFNDTQYGDNHLEYDSQFTLLNTHKTRSSQRVSFQLEPLIKLFDKNIEPRLLLQNISSTENSSPMTKDKMEIKSNSKGGTTNFKANLPIPTLVSRGVTDLNLIGSCELAEHNDVLSLSANDKTFVVSSSAIDMEMNSICPSPENDDEARSPQPEKHLPAPIILPNENHLDVTCAAMSFDMSIFSTVDLDITTIGINHNLPPKDPPLSIDPVGIIHCEGSVNKQPSTVDMSVEMMDQSTNASHNTTTLSSDAKRLKLLSMETDVEIFEDICIDELLVNGTIFDDEVRPRSISDLIEFYQIVMPLEIETKYEKNFEKLVNLLASGNPQETEEIKNLRVELLVEPLKICKNEFTPALKRKVKSLLDCLLPEDPSNWQRFDQDSSDPNRHTISFLKNKAYFERLVEEGLSLARTQVYGAIEDFWKSLAIKLKGSYETFSERCGAIVEREVEERKNREAMVENERRLMNELSAELKRLEDELEFKTRSLNMDLHEEHLDLLEKLHSLQRTRVEKQIQITELSLSIIKLADHGSQTSTPHSPSDDGRILLDPETKLDLYQRMFSWRIKSWATRSIEYYFLQNFFIFKIAFRDDIGHDCPDNPIAEMSLELVPNFDELRVLPKFLAHYALSSYAALKLEKYSTFKDLPKVIATLSDLFCKIKLLNQDVLFCCKRHLVEIPIPPTMPQVIKSSPYCAFDHTITLQGKFLLLNPYGTHSIKVSLNPGSYMREKATFCVAHLTGHNRDEKIREHLSNVLPTQFYLKTCLSYFSILIEGDESC